jgi:hypothetical protein
VHVPMCAAPARSTSTARGTVARVPGHAAAAAIADTQRRACIAAIITHVSSRRRTPLYHGERAAQADSGCTKGPRGLGWCCRCACDRRASMPGRAGQQRRRSGLRCYR